MAAGELSFAIRAVNEARAALQEVERDIGGLGDAADRAAPRTSRLGGALGDVGKIAGGFVVANGLMRMPGLLASSATAAAEDAAATARLEQALRNAGGEFEANNRAVNARIDAGIQLAFSDDAVRDSFQSLLAATGDVSEALSRQQVAMDLARGAGISLEQASKLVGKVNEDNVQAFRRMGIVIKEGSTEAEALAAVQAKFAGQSATYAASTAGQFEQAKLRMGELKEQLGTALLPAMAAVATALTTQVIPAIERFADQAGPKIKTFFADVQRWWDENGKPALDNIVAAWEAVRPAVEPILKQIEDFVTSAFKVIALSIGIVVDLLGGDFSGAWEKTKELVKTVVTYWKDSVRNAVDAIAGLATVAMEAGKAILQGLWDGILWVFDQLRMWLPAIPGAVLGMFGDAASFLYEAGTKIVQGLWAGIESLRGWLYGQVKAFAEGIANAIKDGLGRFFPHSPSKAGIDIGRGLGTGIEVGIRQSLPNVMGGVAAAQMALMGGAAGAQPWRPAVGGGAPGPVSGWNQGPWQGSAGGGMSWGAPGFGAVWNPWTGMWDAQTDLRTPEEAGILPVNHFAKEKSGHVSNVTINVSLPNYLGDRSEVLDVLERELRLRFA